MNASPTEKNNGASAVPDLQEAAENLIAGNEAASTE